MSFIGTWKVKKVFSFDPEEGVKMIPAEEAMAMDDKEMRQMASALMKITENGKMTMYIPVPKELLEQVRAEGAPLTDDGMLIAEEHEWKEENGEFYYFSNMEGTAFDEEISPWEKLELNDEGLLAFGGGMILFEKV